MRAKRTPERDRLLARARGVADMFFNGNAYDTALEREARLRAQNAALRAALVKFRDHYSPSINPYLDEAYGMALDVLREVQP